MSQWRSGGVISRERRAKGSGNPGTRQAAGGNGTELDDDITEFNDELPLTENVSVFDLIVYYFPFVLLTHYFPI